MNGFNEFINKANKRIKVHYLIVVLFIALFLAIGIPTLARYKNRSTINDTIVWDGSIAASYKSGSGTSADPYVISNGQEFAYFANQLNYTDYDGMYFTLDNDILLNDGIFEYSKENGLTITKNNNKIGVTPFLDSYSDINKFNPINTFKGHLNGNSYRIYGLFITSNTEQLALFNNLEGEIKDLYLENTVIYGGFNTAGLAVNSNNSNINNVLLNGYVVGNSNSVDTSEVIQINDIEKITSENLEEKVNLDIPVINGTISSIKLTGNYTSSNPDAVLKINGQVIANEQFELTLENISNELIINYETLTETTFNLTNLEYSINYKYGSTSGIVSNSNNTSFAGVINKANIYGTINANGLVNILSGTSTIVHSYNTGNINSTNSSSGLVNLITNNTTNITITYSYNSGTLTSTNNAGLVNKIINNNTEIGIEKCFNTTNDYVVNEIKNSTALINSVATTTNGIKNGTFNGSVQTTNDFITFSKNNGFNEFIDLEDLNTNTSNLWVYDTLPILYIDDINNPVASINIDKYSWNNVGYKLHTVKFGSKFSFNITSVDNMHPVKETYYYISKSKTALRKNEINNITNWTQYSNPVNIEEEGFYVIYVKVVDYNDNVTYLNSDLIVLDLSGSSITISMNDNTWNNLNNNQEDIYLNNNASLSVVAVDDLSGVKSISYYLSDNYLTDTELNEIDTWIKYNNTITVDSKTGKIVYVKVLDNTDYVSYANTSKIVIDGYRQSKIVAGNNIPSTDNLKINEKSSVSMTYTFSDNNNYKEGYKHVLRVNKKLPKNTIITLIDNSNSRAYRYKLTEELDKLFFTNFTEVGNKNNIKYTENTTGKINDSYKINMDFSKTTLSANLEDIKVSIELLNGDEVIRPIITSTVKPFSVYKNINYSANLTSNYNNTIYYNTENTYNIDFKTTYSTNSNVIDSTTEGKSIGIALRVIDSNNQIVSKTNLRNMTFTYNNKKYSAGSDGIIRINLNNGLNTTSGNIIVETSLDNIKLKTGNYKLQLGYFIASDGVYSKNIIYTKDINLSVLNNNIKSNYNFNVTMNNNDRIIAIDKNKTINFKVLLNSELTNPIVRVSLSKKNNLSAYNQAYTKVDLKNYLKTNLSLYNNYIYNTSIKTNNTLYQEFNLEFDTTKFEHTGYKLTFDLYNGDTKLDSISKKIIVK